MTVISELERAIRKNIVTCDWYGGDAYFRCKFWKDAETTDGDKARQCVNTDKCDSKILPTWTLTNLTPMQRRHTRYNRLDFIELEKTLRKKQNA